MTKEGENINSQEQEGTTDVDQPAQAAVATGETGEAEQTSASPPAKKKGRWLRRLSWTLAALLLLVVLLPFALYIPWVQNVAKDWACDYVNRTTGLTVSIDRILIKFPLDVSVDGLLVLDEHKDTMIRAENFTAGIAFRPLLDLRVEADEARLKNGYYHLVSSDSSMLLTADVNECRLSGPRIDMDHNIIDLLDGELTGGRVELVYQPWKVVHEPDTPTSNPWRITSKRLALNNVDYTMVMLPTIDTLQVHLDHAMLEDGLVDTGTHVVDARYLAVDQLDARYTYLDEASAREFDRLHPVPPDPYPRDTATWTVTGDSVRLKGGHAIYAVAGKAPPTSSGMDMNYIEVSDVKFAVDDFYNRGTSVKVPVMSLTARERGGLAINEASGTARIDDNAIDVQDFRLKTSGSDIYLDAHVPMATIDDPGTGEMRVTTNSSISLRDLALAMPSLEPALRNVPQVRPLVLSGEVKGNTNSVRLNNVHADLPHSFTATATGHIDNPTDFNRMVGHVNVDARIENIDFAKPTLMDQAMGKQVNLPPMNLKADISLNRGTVSGDADVRLQGGSLVGRGSFNANSEGYEVDATANNFPVQAILPTLGVKDVTAHVVAKGKGFDFLSSGTNVDATVDVQRITYNNVTYSNIDTRVNLKNGMVDARVASGSPGRDFVLDVDGTIAGDHYVLDVAGRLNDLDVQALGYYDGPCRGSANVRMRCDLDLRAKDYSGEVHVTDLDWRLGDEMIFSNAADVTFDANKEHVSFLFNDEGTEMSFQSESSVDDFLKMMKQTGDEAMEQYKTHDLDINALKEKLPPFNFWLRMGPNGIVPRYLGRYDIDFRDVSCEISNDSTLFMDAWVHSLSVGQTAIDTINIHASEWNKYLAFDAHMGNRPGTWDEFAQVDIKGGARGSTVDFLVEQHNIKHEMGYRLGVNATLEDSVVNAHFFPTQPVIGYRDWTLNEGNFVKINFVEKQLGANLALQSGKSLISLVAKPGTNPEENVISLDVDKLVIEEWTSLVPGLTDMKGELNADMEFTYNGDDLEGNGQVILNNFYYDNRKVGDLALNTSLAVDPATSNTRLNATLDMDGSTVAMAMGTVNDTTKGKSLDLSLKMDRFPLRKISAFIPGRMISLRGYADGDLRVTGAFDNPILNGYLQGDSAQIRLPRYGSTLLVGDERIPVNNNVINFKNFVINGLNGQPVLMNGTVDFRSFDDMKYDLSLRGRNVQFIGEEQRGYSEIFGKGFADIDATVRGRGDLIDVRADLTLLKSSNITYVMQDEVAAATSKTDDHMVTFVDPTLQTNMLDSLMTANTTSALTVLANIDVQQGAKINVFLSSDGKDHANIEGNASLKYSIDFTGKDKLTGTYYITGGVVRYQPPVISQKVFNLVEGSTITWTGDMFDPTLDLTGVQHIKTSVSDDAGSRLVEFDITAHIANTLSHMDLSFDLSAPADMSVENELQTMTNDQRSQSAINLLLYNTYSGLNSNPNVNINGTIAGNALFSFLQSQLNTWAASTLKGVELSFGINQYDATVSGKTGVQTSYSYHLSKTLFNDRLKIVVGGEYSTEASAEENFSKNLINDVSIEYMLNESGTRYVRLFHNTGVESVIEGKIMKTGVGFVMKHKLSSLGDLFHRNRKKDPVPIDSNEIQEYYDDDIPYEPVDTLIIKDEK